MSLLEILAVLVTVAGIGLTALRRVAGWPISLAASVLYLLVFAQAHLWADSALQIVFCLFLLKGWIGWSRAPRSETAVIVQEANGYLLLRDGALAVPCGLALGAALERWTNDPAPYTDAALSVASIVGQLWTARRYIACWPLWIAIDSAYVVLFMIREMEPSAALYAVLVLLAAYGWSSWHRASRTPACRSGTRSGT